jgi:type II secretory pathway pseudopilin PulG
MKPSLNLSRARFAGFTMVEMCVVMALFSFLMIAIVAIQFFAAHVYTLAATKLTATASGRKIMNIIRDQVRGGGVVRVGIYDPAGDTFSLISIGTSQIGNALVIYTNNPNNQIPDTATLGTCYFMNPQASNICSVVVSNDINGSVIVLTATRVDNIVVYITNYYAFDAEDCSNKVLTTYENNRLIHVKFQFSQWEYPLAGVGGGAMYDYYQLQTRVAPRIINY